MDSPIPRPAIRSTGIAMIVLTTLVAIARAAVTFIQHRNVTGEDLWLLASYSFFLVVSILYLYIVPAFFRLTDLAVGAIEPYPTAGDDAVFIQKGLFVASASLWFCLWSAKFSLLFMYKKLVDKLPLYLKLWWALAIFSALSLVGAMITLFLACSNMEAWFTAGMCYTPRDIVHAAISIWYAYAVDVLTDLLIMFLPLRLVLNLQMPLSRKLGIVGLFCLGWICIAASTIRVTQLANPGHQPTVPWLAVWGTIESAIAFITVSGPGLYRAAKLLSKTRRKYYVNEMYHDSNTGGNSKQGASRLGRSQIHDDSVQLRSLGGTSAITAAASNSSEEELFGVDRGAIHVRTAVTVESKE
ncbi:uncharacterized protein B0I36DRAFT_332652 [Microdochium trichocladiopsis]|uniref:Rhodopsin domain-containing protein n=1 Tax=Microdochium trichocladiopsis TaxID=1682393 RepID=A0A9P8XWT4_9PEZI|nr:uncharacterized protein B0I36DRAFT_338175 [Microdochium trichocladiopsis]XP_046008742.1 uncharacterized protein B0I36DRAFT_332652 [Microdochium trichocladiopsis]KAH7016580.1 hypothetical protein B0I36DRAFT_338175 [Microdochium trichocladiopsis]KAH7025194.1 hypothetical protein B0I36DRAFT_332652 [Microdochium trichocladiopsis]